MKIIIYKIVIINVSNSNVPFLFPKAKTQPETHLTPNPHSTTTAHPPTIDPIQHLIQQMGGMQNVPGIQQSSINTTSTATQEDNPIKSLLRQLNVNANGHPQTSHIDTVWPQPPPQINPQFNAQNWLAQVRTTCYV